MARHFDESQAAEGPRKNCCVRSYFERPVCLEHGALIYEVGSNSLLVQEESDQKQSNLFLVRSLSNLR